MKNLDSRIVDIIGAQIDLGASRRGVNMGPSAIRYAGLLEIIHDFGLQCFDKGDISNMPVEDKNLCDNNSKLKNLESITKVNSKLYDMVRQSLEENHFPLVLGGDHSIAAGTILGVQSIYKNIGVIWVDAHGDYNNEHTSPSGNLHGMSMAASTGYGPEAMIPFKPKDIDFVNPDNVALIGARCLDNEEKKLLKESGVHVFTMADIDKFGMKEVMKTALSIVEKNTSGFHVSFDLDAINPNEAPGVGTPVPGGLTFREAHLIAEMIAESQNLLSAEIVELNPILDEKNKTGQLAVHLIMSLLGQTIF